MKSPHIASRIFNDMMWHCYAKRVHLRFRSIVMCCGIIVVPFLQSCLSFELELQFTDNNSGTIGIYYVFEPKMLEEKGLSDASEPLFPWTRDDYELIATLYDGIGLLDLHFSSLSSFRRALTVVYSFANLESLNQLLHDFGMEVAVQQRRGSTQLLFNRHSLPVEVPMESSVEMRSSEDAGFTLQIMRLLFPELPIRYLVNVPQPIQRVSRGRYESSQAILEGTLSALSSSHDDFEWTLSW